MAEFVRLEVDGAIGTIRLNRPPMNALGIQVREELRAVAHEADARDDVRAVVVYGGEKEFCAGADIKEMANGAVRSHVRTQDQKIGMKSFVEEDPGKARFTGR